MPETTTIERLITHMLDTAETEDRHALLDVEMGPEEVLQKVDELSEVRFGFRPLQTALAKREGDEEACLNALSALTRLTTGLNEVVTKLFSDASAGVNELREMAITAPFLSIGATVAPAAIASLRQAVAHAIEQHMRYPDDERAHQLMVEYCDKAAELLATVEVSMLLHGLEPLQSAAQHQLDAESSEDYQRVKLVGEVLREVRGALAKATGGEPDGPTILH